MFMHVMAASDDEDDQRAFMQMEKATQLAAKAGPQAMADIDTDDEKDEETQYELWKGREMGRIRCSPCLSSAALSPAMPFVVCVCVCARVCACWGVVCACVRWLCIRTLLHVCLCICVGSNMPLCSLCKADGQDSHAVSLSTGYV